jgi:GNAT superfamily N-acetyltransferase
VNEVQLAGPTFETRSLTDRDAAELQGLLERCADYFQVVYSREPGPAEALAVFYAGPEEGRDPKNKIFLGVTERGRSDLVGVLDAFRDYPMPGSWYIGLLLLDPRARRAGLGAQILEEFVLFAARSGARELQLNVVEQNTLAHAFWSRHSFQEVRRWPQCFGERESVFIRMSRPLV